jgi:hypothetical protein
LKWELVKQSLWEWSHIHLTSSLHYSQCNLHSPNYTTKQHGLILCSFALVSFQPIPHIPILQEIISKHLILSHILIQKLLHHCHILSSILQHLKHECGCQTPTLFNNTWLHALVAWTCA